MPHSKQIIIFSHMRTDSCITSFNFPHASWPMVSTGLHCMHWHHTIINALTGQEHTRIKIVFLVNVDIYWYLIMFSSICLEMASFIATTEKSPERSKSTPSFWSLCKRIPWRRCALIDTLTLHVISEVWRVVCYKWSSAWKGQIFL